MKRVSIIGSGFSSLSAACYLAQAGYQVDVYEKNEQAGGRARRLKKDGFTFDMGPSWYWMPDVFERFFADFNKTPSDYYELLRLNPGYTVYFEDGSHFEIPDSIEGIRDLFEREEPGSGKQFDAFMKDAASNYAIAMGEMVYKPGVSPLELITPRTMLKFSRFFTNIRTEVRRKFKSDKLRRLMEFPVLFLGAKPQDTPAFYNFMNHADFKLGTWYPKGGMYEVVNALLDLAGELGVNIQCNCAVEQIVTVGQTAIGLKINGDTYYSDIILSGADYHHTESLLDVSLRGYSDTYWNKRTFAPSALLYYVGFSKKLINLSHHTLFFDEDFDKHANTIYDNPSWPVAPLFYASFPGITDETCAPVGKESGTFLIPLAPDLEDNEELREYFLDNILRRLEKHTGQSVIEHIEFHSSYCVKDFKKDYNSYKGNAYGMANTLSQTAFLRPGLKSKKAEGLYFTGQLTVPGPGVPPALISGKLAAEMIIKEHKIKQVAYHEKLV